MSTRQISGILEVDEDRGVIYFHPYNQVADDSATLLRICQLPTPIPAKKFLDITHMHGVNWDGKPGHLPPKYRNLVKAAELTAKTIELATQMGTCQSEALVSAHGELFNALAELQK